MWHVGIDLHRTTVAIPGTPITAAESRPGFWDFPKQSQGRNGERLAWGPGGGNEHPWSANGFAETFWQGCLRRVVRSIVFLFAPSRLRNTHMVDTHSCRPSFRPSHIVLFTGRSAQSQ